MLRVLGTSFYFFFFFAQYASQADLEFSEFFVSLFCVYWILMSLLTTPVS